jgi:CRP-like cAMP-binding protein
VRTATETRKWETMTGEAAEMVDDLRALPLFEGLSDQVLRILATAARRRSFDPGEVLFHQGEQGTTCHVILSGTVRIYVIGEDGRELAVRIMRAGETVGEMALFDDQPRSASVEALELIRTLELDQDVLLRCVQRSPRLALHLLSTLSRRLRLTTEDAEGLASLTVTERLLRQLRRLARHSGVSVEGGTRIVPPMTQQDLAALVGTSRESVNRALVRLREEDVVRLEDGWIVLLDEAG